MHPRSAEYSLRTTSSPLESHQPPIAGPSPSPSPTPQTPAATLNSVKETGTDIIGTIEGWHKKTPTAQALADALRISLTKHEVLLNTLEAPNNSAFTSLQDLNDTLRDIQRAVNAEIRPRKRHVAKGMMMKLFGVEHADIFSLCQTRVVSAFQALELSPLATKSTAPTSTSQQGASTSAVGGDTPAASQPGWSDRAKTALDASETVFQFAVGVGEAVPLAGSTIKAVGSIGQTIIRILNDVVNNNEEAKSLAKYVQGLIATAERFMENNGAQIGDETVVRLGACEATLKAVRSELEGFMAQGGFRQGVSHLRNKEVLAGCDTQIRRSFTQLQVHLSLHTVRLLTNLGDADAQRMRRDLLDRLGDGDTGATDKASDPADLMCLEGTRIELLDEVDGWASDPSSKRVLWINGVAGCGKSALAATIASRREEQSATAVFHFSRSNQPRNKRVVCSIARQLAQKVARGDKGSPEHLVLSSVKTNPDIATAYLSIQFKELLVKSLSKLLLGSPPVLIIIDALDEWDNLDAASKLVDLIQEHSDKLPASVKFLLTSRKESHLSRAFGEPRTISIVKSLALDTAPRATVDHDIRTYVTKHFDRIRFASPELSAENWPGTKAIEKLVGLSGGLFQWASTVVRFIEEGGHKVRLREIFATPNQFGDLDELYQLVLSRLLKTNKRKSISTLLRNVLGSIVAAPTPISLDVLVYLHATGHNTFEDTTSDIKEILGALGSLLIVPPHPDQPIRALHPSIIDFLTDHQRCTDPRLYADRILQHRRLALICLDRMQRDLKRDICGVGDPGRFNTDPDVQELVSKHIPDSLRYACRYWAKHLLASGVANIVEVDVPLEEFCTRCMLFWFEVMGLTGLFQSAVAAIRIAEQWATLRWPDSTDSITQRLLLDARRFLLLHYEPIANNAAHIYISALSIAPSGTDLAKTYQNSTTIGIRALAGPVSPYWPRSLWVADRHSGPVNCCAFSRDGKVLASGSDDRTLRLWDVETGVQKGRTLEGHTDIVSCLEFTFDGKTLISGSYDNTLRLWDVKTGVQKGPTLKGHTKEVRCLALSPDPRILASGSDDQTLRLWDIRTGKQVGPTLEGHSAAVTCVVYSSDGRILASGSDDQTLRLWDAVTGVQKGRTFEGHTDIISCLTLSPDGRILASGSDDRTLRLWNVEAKVHKKRTFRRYTGSTQLNNMTTSRSAPSITSSLSDEVTENVSSGAGLLISCLILSAPSLMVALGTHDRFLSLWDTESRREDGSAWNKHISSLVFSFNSSTLIWGSVGETLRLWDVQTGAQKGPALKGHAKKIRCMALSPDGGTLASGSDDQTLRLWDVEPGEQNRPMLRGHTQLVSCHVLSSDGRTLVSASEDQTLRLWDVETGVQKGLALEGPSRGVRCLALSSDGRILASGSDDRILRLWNLGTGGQEGMMLKGHTDWIRCLALSPSGRTLASGSDDRTLRLWDVETGRQQQCIPALSSRPPELKFSSTGRKVAIRFADSSVSTLGVDAEAGVRPAAPGECASDVGFPSTETAIRIGRDGWILSGTTRWFWLPAAYGRDVPCELRDDRLIFRHDCHICIIDVSGVMSLIK